MPGVVRDKVVRVVVQKFDRALLDVEDLLPDVILGRDIVVPSVCFYDVFNLPLGFRLRAFRVGDDSRF